MNRGRSFVVFQWRTWTAILSEEERKDEDTIQCMCQPTGWAIRGAREAATRILLPAGASYVRTSFSRMRINRKGAGLGRDCQTTDRPVPPSSLHSTRPPARLYVKQTHRSQISAFSPCVVLMLRPISAFRARMSSCILAIVSVGPATR